MTSPKAAVHFRTGLFREDGRSARLLASKCNVCGALAFPSRTVCAQCNGFDGQQIVELSEQGVLYAFAVVRQAPKQFPTPYVIGYIDTDDGVRVFTQITAADPSALRLGARMRSIVSVMAEPSDEGSGDRVTYTFEPVKED